MAIIVQGIKLSWTGELLYDIPYSTRMVGGTAIRTGKEEMPG